MGRLVCLAQLFTNGFLGLHTSVQPRAVGGFLGFQRQHRTRWLTGQTHTETPCHLVQRALCQHVCTLVSVEHWACASTFSLQNPSATLMDQALEDSSPSSTGCHCCWQEEATRRSTQVIPPLSTSRHKPGSPWRREQGATFPGLWGKPCSTWHNYWKVFLSVEFSRTLIFSWKKFPGPRQGWGSEQPQIKEEHTQEGAWEE